MAKSSSTNSNKVVEAIGLTKTFKDFWFRTRARAVDGIDFDIHPQEIFGLLGPNGSGKSTTIKMILGLLHVTKGRLAVFGKSPNDVSIKKRIGFLPEESYLYRFLNAEETLDYYGKLFGLDRRTRRMRTEQLLDMVGLSQVSHRAVGEFSKGMQRRVGIAQALINDPDFLILDEPTSGLDPIGTRQVKDLILELGRRGKTILLSSHLLSDVEDVCDRVVMLYGGQVRAEGPTRELLADTQSTVIQTPRLRPETISRIEQVIQEMEHVGIDKVDAPRQRLEDLFMDIVEKARQDQIATSGASEGQGTARFLRADGEEEGDELISSLVDGERETDQTRAVEKTKLEESAARERAVEKRDEVLDELLSEKDEAPARSVEVGKEPDRPENVDDDMIRDLLSSDGDDAGGDGR